MPRGKRWLVPFASLAALLGALFGACTRRPTPPAAIEEIRLGEFYSLSGPQGPFGIAAHAGVQLAVDEANLGGGIAGRKVKLISYDDHGDAADVVKLVERLAQTDNVLVAIGEVATSLSLAAAPVAQRLKVPMISPGSTHPDVTRLGDYIFRVCFTDPFQGAVMARFALNFLQLKKGAIFMDGTTEYSRGLAEHFALEYTGGGGKILARGEYRPKDPAFEKGVAAIVAARPDLIFLPGYFTEAGAIAAEARRLGFQGIFLGGDGWEGEGLLRTGATSLEGSYFSNHFSAEDRNPEVQSFVARFEGRYHRKPSAFAAAGYDAGKVALDAIRRANPLTRANVREALASTRNFPGVTGIITISPSRDAVKPAVVLRVRAKGPFQYVTTVNP